MAIIPVIVTLVVLGFLLWVINLIPMPYPIKLIINLVVIAYIIIWLLQIFGVIGPMGNFHFMWPQIK